MGENVYEGFAFVEGASPNYDGTTPTTQDIADMIIRLTQTSQMSVLGVSHDTVPDSGKGGNVCLNVFVFSIWFEKHVSLHR